MCGLPDLVGIREHGFAHYGALMVIVRYPRFQLQSFSLQEKIYQTFLAPEDTLRSYNKLVDRLRKKNSVSAECHPDKHKMKVASLFE